MLAHFPSSPPYLLPRRSAALLPSNNLTSRRSAVRLWRARGRIASGWVGEGNGTTVL